MVLVPGAKLAKKKAGCTMRGLLRLSGPPSMTKTMRLGSVSASLEAIMHPAVPPTIVS